MHVIIGQMAPTWSDVVGNRKTTDITMGRFVVGTITAVTIASTGGYGMTEGFQLDQSIRVIVPAAAVVQDAADEAVAALAPTATVTASPTASPSPTPTDTVLPIDTPTSTATPTDTPTLTATLTPTTMPTAIPTDTATPTATMNSTATSTPTTPATPSPTPSPSPMPTHTPTATAAPSPTVVPTVPPFVGRWPINQTSVEIVGDDATAGSFHIRIPVAYSMDTPPGGAPWSLVLDGNYQRLLSDAVLTTMTDTMTLQLWVKWEGQLGEHALLFYNGQPGVDGYGVRVTAQGELQIAVGDMDLATDGILDHNWNLITLLRDQGTWQLYLNETLLQIEGDAVPQQPTGATVIGGDYLHGQRYFRGLIDNFAIYHMALSPQEVQQIYQGVTPQ